MTRTRRNINCSEPDCTCKLQHAVKTDQKPEQVTDYPCLASLNEYDELEKLQEKCPDVGDLDFKEELRVLINKYSMENGSNTPDLILANYMQNCLDAFDQATRERTAWYDTTIK